jgi:hypothetical protein
MPNDFKYDVFLSHSAKDTPVVRELANRLIKDNIRVWFESDPLSHRERAGVREKALLHSRVLILCISANTFASDWPQSEAETLRFRDPLNQERRFIPLWLNEAHII